MAKQYTSKSMFNDRFETPDGKVFKFDPASERSRYEAGERADKHYRALKASREAQAGRDVTGQEMVANMMEHPEDRDIVQKMRDSEFKPKLDAKPLGRFERHRQDIQERIRQRDLAALPPLERQLADLEAIEAREKAEADNTAKKLAHFKNPNVSAALEQLNGLLDSMRFDPSRSKSEIIRVQQAIQQWETVDGCQATGEEMLRAVLDHEDALEAAFVTETEAKIAELQATLPKKAQPEHTPDPNGYPDPMADYQPDLEPEAELPKASIDTSKALGQQIADLSYQSFEKDWPLQNRQEIFSAEQALRDGNEAAAMECLNKYSG